VREASTCLEQSLRCGMSGSTTEAAVLLQTLAEKYRDLGQPAVAIGLLRRAVIYMSEPTSRAQLDAAAQARVALGDVLAEMGAPTEQALAQYRVVVQLTLADDMPAPVLESLKASKRAAATAAAALLQAEGRAAESMELLGSAE
jgi:hypothetical protein